MVTKIINNNAKNKKLLKGINLLEPSKIASNLRKLKIISIKGKKYLILIFNLK
jgi:hypothetical protein